MATPRKHWFRVSDSLLREPWSRDEKLTWVLLLAWLNQRWARDGLTAEEACAATLSRAAMQEITGRAQLVHSRRALRALGAHVTISIRERGEFTEIHLPKFSEFQHLESGAREKQGRKLPPPPPPPQDAPAEREPGGRKAPSKSVCPEHLTEDQRESLLTWAAKRGLREAHVRYAFQRVRDWSISKGERRADWVATIRNAIREGWGLEGHVENGETIYQRELKASPFRLSPQDSDQTRSARQ